MKKILRNRTLAIALVLFLLMGMLTPLASAADFGDTSGHWGEAAIGKWADYGIIEGDGVNFRPDDPVTRGEFAVIVNRIAKYQKAAANTFSDLEAGLWYTDAMLKLNAAGVLNGDGGGRISPNGTLPREQAIAILARMFDVEPDASGLTGFSDAATVDVWARAEVGGMAKAGYVQGSGGKLDPKGILTRSSAVQLFDNIIKGFYNTAGTYTIETDGIVVVNTTGVVLTNSKIGALFVTQGIGANGDFTLKNSNVQSFTVEGGGEHSIIIDNSTVGSLTVSVDSSTGNVRIHLTGGSEVEDAYVFVEGSEIVYFTNDTGTVVGSITVSEDGTIVVTGEVGEVNVVGDDVKVVVESSGKVGSINIEGDGAILDVSGAVEEVIVNGDDASVEGTGKVESVKVESGEGTEITTGGTKVEVSDNAGDVKTKDGEIKSGESDTTPENTGGGGGGGYVPSGPTLASASGINNTVKVATSGTTDAQTITVSGFISYDDNVFGGTLATDFSGAGWEILASDGKPNTNIIFGKFTAISISNFHNLLTQAGIAAGEQFTIVQKNDAFKVYGNDYGSSDGNYIKNRATPYSLSDFNANNPFNILLMEGKTVEIKVYNDGGVGAGGTPEAGTLVLTLTINTTGLTIGNEPGTKGYALEAGKYYKIVDETGDTSYYVKADGTRAANIGEIGAITTTGIYFLPFITGDTLVVATPYTGNVDYNYSAGSGYVGDAQNVTASSGVATIVTGGNTSRYYEISVGALFTGQSLRLAADKTNSNFHFAILGRSGSIDNGTGTSVTAGPFYVWETNDAGPTVVWEAYKAGVGGQTVTYPTNVAFVGLFLNNSNAGGMTHQINMGYAPATTTDRTFIFDCDNGEFIFLKVVLAVS